MKNMLTTLIGSGLKTLSKPGDSIHAYINPTGRQVVKTVFDGVKHSAVKYSSGKIVETIVHLPKK